MIVVSDTSPLNYLILIDAVDVLPTLFREILVPPVIIEELQRVRAAETVRMWAAAPPAWLRVQSPSIDLRVDDRLDSGEAQAISLAKEIGAELILIDERKGRRVAIEQGIKTAGTLAVLELAAERRFLDLRANLQALQQTTFYVRPEQIELALERDARRKRNHEKP